MKKILSVLLIFALLLIGFNFVSCKETEKSGKLYDSFICDMANDGIITEFEKNWWDGMPKEDSMAEKEKQITLEGITYNCKYSHSEYSLYSSALENVYSDYPHTIDITIDSSNNKVIGFHKKNLLMYDYSLKPDVYTTKEEAFLVAKAEAEQHINIDEYMVTATVYQPKSIDVTEYQFDFVRYVDGFPTSERVYISVTSKGDIRTMHICNIDLFKDKTISIDKDVLAKSVENKLNEVYAQKYDFTYKIVKQTLACSPEGEFVIVSQIEVSLVDMYSTGVILATVIP